MDSDFRHISFRNKAHWTYDVGVFGVIAIVWAVYFYYSRSDDLPVWLWALLIFAIGIGLILFYDRATSHRIRAIVIAMELALGLGYGVASLFGSVPSKFWALIAVTFSISALLFFIGWLKMRMVEPMLQPRDTDEGERPLEILDSERVGLRNVGGVSSRGSAR